MNGKRHKPEQIIRNPRLSEVPLALILKRTLAARAKERGKSLAIVDITLGYELRCADPIAFDVEYTHQLGWGAVRYLLKMGEGGGRTAGAMISIQDGEVVPIPLADILDVETGKTGVRHVNVELDYCQAAFSQMIRLEPGDVDDRSLVRRMAAAAGTTQKQFRANYGVVVGA